MPEDGPDAPRPSGPPRPNEHRLLALGRAIERGPRRRPGGPARTGRRRRRGPLRNLSRGGRIAVFSGAGFTVLVAIAALAVFIDYLYLEGLAHHKPVGREQNATSRSENILLVGSTNRCAPGMRPNPAYGLCTDGVTGVNSDIVMVVHLDANTHTAGLLSIPRDTFIPNARKEGANKIDAALYETPTQLVTAIEEDFGIPINHFVELNFDTFASVVDIVGGVDMDFPMRVYDAESGLNIEHPGCYHLDGIHALQVVRARHLQIGWFRTGTFVAPLATGTRTPFYFGTDPHQWPEETQSDLARIRRTHEFLRVVADKISSLGIGDLARDQDLATSVLPSLTVDDRFSFSHMISLANTWHGVSIGSIPQDTYPVVEYFGDPSDAYDYFYQGFNYGEVVFPVEPGGWQTVDTAFGAKPWQSTWNYKNLPKPDGFRTSVVNSTATASEQNTIATQLTHKGFRISQTGTRASVGTSSETVVWYGGPPPPTNSDWKSASLGAAERVITTLQGPVVLGYDPAEVTPGDMVTVQIGSDLTVATRDWTAIPVTTTTLKSTSTSTSSTVHTTPTTHPVTATTVFDPPALNRDNNFSSPSDVAQPLQPWDPRACTPSQRVFVDTSGDPTR